MKWKKPYLFLRICRLPIPPQNPMEWHKHLALLPTKINSGEIVWLAPVWRRFWMAIDGVLVSEYELFTAHRPRQPTTARPSWSH